MYLPVCLCGYVHVTAGAHGGQRSQIPLKLELQVVERHLTWC